jgi:hypothetical protein
VKIILLAFALLLAGCQSTSVNVPSIVRESFEKQFPNAANVEWSKESEDEFEAEYELNGAEQSSNYNAAGEWLITETEIAQSELPTAVQETIIREFFGYTIDEVEKAETSDGLFFELQLKKDKKEIEVKIASDGKMIGNGNGN